MKSLTSLYAKPTNIGISPISPAYGSLPRQTNRRSPISSYKGSLRTQQKISKRLYTMLFVSSISIASINLGIILYF